VEEMYKAERMGKRADPWLTPASSLKKGEKKLF